MQATAGEEEATAAGEEQLVEATAAGEQEAEEPVGEAELLEVEAPTAAGEPAAAAPPPNAHAHHLLFSNTAPTDCCPTAPTDCCPCPAPALP